MCNVACERTFARICYICSNVGEQFNFQLEGGRNPELKAVLRAAQRASEPSSARRIHLHLRGMWVSNSMVNIVKRGRHLWFKAVLRAAQRASVPSSARNKKLSAPTAMWVSVQIKGGWNYAVLCCLQCGAVPTLATSC